MSEALKSLLEQALELPSAERAKVAEELLSSLDHPDAEIDQVWAQEVESRLRAYREGKQKSVPIDSILS
ncbi:MAG: addiction module protein [Pseudomonadota bacterium]